MAQTPDKDRDQDDRSAREWNQILQWNGVPLVVDRVQRDQYLYNLAQERRFIEPLPPAVVVPSREQVVEYGGKSIDELPPAPLFSAQKERLAKVLDLYGSGLLTGEQARGLVSGGDLNPEEMTYGQIERSERPFWYGREQELMAVKPARVVASAQGLAEKVKIPCPDHSKLTVLTYRDRESLWVWKCPKKGCNFEVVWGSDEGRQVQMVLIILGRIKVLAFEGAGEQGFMPVCPLCRMEMVEGSDPGKLFCRACPFNITRGYLDQFRTGQKRPASIDWINWPKGTSEWVPFSESLNEAVQRVAQGRKITFEEGEINAESERIQERS